MTLDKQVKEFVKARGIQKIVGFSGGINDLGIEISKIIFEAIEVFAKYPVAVLSGGTGFSVPLYAVNFAKRFSIPTIGIMPVKGEKYAIPSLDLKLVIEPRYLESEWGDESEIFAKLADGTIYVGGMYGTLIEYAHVMKINQDRIKKNQEPIYVALIQNTGSILEPIHALSDKVMSQCFPEKPVYTGKDAAEFIIKKLFKMEE